MATWPSGSKASTTNLDSGTDRPSLARADIKQNVDNVNDIIDMFNISGPSNNQILKYNTSNSRFELASDADLNTTYTIAAVTDGSDANIRLTGSDSSIDEIQLIAGSNITLSVTSAGAISIAAAGSTGMTSFTLAGDSGSSQTISDGNTLTIAGGTNLTSVASATDTITLNLDTTISGLTSVSSETVTLSTTSTSGALNVTFNPATASGSAVNLSGKDSQGGTGYFDFLKITNTTSGATNPNKTLRMNSTGNIEIINSAYSSNIFNLSDAGVLTVPSLISSGAITFKDTREALYDLGTTGGTIAPNAANGSVQKITLNSALTINAFTSPVAGQSVTLIIYGGTSYTSITSTMKFAGGVKTLTGTAGCIDILSIYYDGTNYFASLGKGFA